MNSKDYWAKREAEATKNYIKYEAEYSRQINKIYSDMLDACQKEIDAFYGKYAAKEGITIAEAKKRVSSLDIAEYERKAKRYVKDKDFSDKANEEMRLYNATMKINRLEMLKANIGLELISGHDEIDKFMGGILKGRTEEELARQAGILGKTVRSNSRLAHTIPNGSFHNATFSDRIWMYQDIMKADLGKLLQSGLIQGKNSRAIAKDLKNYWYGNDPKTGKGATYCMERLMRTELARVQIEAQKQSYERDGIDTYMFITNSKCCDACQALNGKHFKVKDMMPGENAPPLHPNCRCSTAAYFDRKEYDEWLDSLSNGGKTAYNEALKGKQIKDTGTAQKAGNEPKNNEFIPSKTLEEAETFIKQYVDDKGFGALGVSYKGIGVDVANSINKTISRFYETFNVDKFGGIVAPAGNTKLGQLISNATAAYSPVRNSFLVNRQSMKTMKAAQKAFEAERKATYDLINHPERYDFSKLSKRALAVVERSKVSGRSTVPDTVEETLNHELGHMLEKKVFTHPKWEEAKNNMPQYADGISGYAGENASEYVAESFASYLKGESVADPVIVEIFESLKR